MERAGFTLVEYKECYKMIRIIRDQEKVFPIFIMTGQKSDHG